MGSQPGIVEREDVLDRRMREGSLGVAELERGDVLGELLSERGDSGPFQGTETPLDRQVERAHERAADEAEVRDDLMHQHADELAAHQSHAAGSGTGAATATVAERDRQNQAVFEEQRQGATPRKVRRGRRSAADGAELRTVQRIVSDVEEAPEEEIDDADSFSQTQGDDQLDIRKKDLQGGSGPRAEQVVRTDTGEGQVFVQPAVFEPEPEDGVRFEDIPRQSPINPTPDPQALELDAELVRRARSFGYRLAVDVADLDLRHTARIAASIIDRTPGTEEFSPLERAAAQERVEAYLVTAFETKRQELVESRGQAEAASRAEIVFVSSEPARTVAPTPAPAATPETVPAPVVSAPVTPVARAAEPASVQPVSAPVAAPAGQLLYSTPVSSRPPGDPEAVISERGFFGWLATNVVNGVRSAANAVVTAVETVGKAAYNVAALGVHAVSKVASWTAFTAIPAVWNWTMSTALPAIRDFGIGVLRTAGNAIAWTASTAWWALWHPAEAAVSAWNGISNAVSTVWGGVKSALSFGWNVVTTTFSAGWNVLKGLYWLGTKALEGAWWVATHPSEAWDKLKESVTQFGATVKRFAEAAWRIATDKDLWIALKNLAEKGFWATVEGIKEIIRHPEKLVAVGKAVLSFGKTVVVGVAQFAWQIVESTGIPDIARSGWYFLKGVGALVSGGDWRTNFEQAGRYFGQGVLKACEFVGLAQAARCIYHLSREEYGAALGQAFWAVLNLSTIGVGGFIRNAGKQAVTMALKQGFPRLGTMLGQQVIKAVGKETLEQGAKEVAEKSLTSVMTKLGSGIKGLLDNAVAAAPSNPVKFITESLERFMHREARRAAFEANEAFLRSIHLQDHVCKIVKEALEMSAKGGVLKNQGRHYLAKQLTEAAKMAAETTGKALGEAELKLLTKESWRMAGTMQKLIRRGSHDSQIKATLTKYITQEVSSVIEKAAEAQFRRGAREVLETATRVAKMQDDDAARALEALGQKYGGKMKEAAEKIVHEIKTHPFGSHLDEALTKNLDRIVDAGARGLTKGIRHSTHMVVREGVHRAFREFRARPKAAHAAGIAVTVRAAQAYTPEENSQLDDICELTVAVQEASKRIENKNIDAAYEVTQLAADGSEWILRFEWSDSRNEFVFRGRRQLTSARPTEKDKDNSAAPETVEERIARLADAHRAIRERFAATTA